MRFNFWCWIPLLSPVFRLIFEILIKLSLLRTWFLINLLSDFGLNFLLLSIWCCSLWWFWHIWEEYIFHSLTQFFFIFGYLNLGFQFLFWGSRNCDFWILRSFGCLLEYESIKFLLFLLFICKHSLTWGLFLNCRKFVLSFLKLYYFTFLLRLLFEKVFVLFIQVSKHL